MTGTHENQHESILEAVAVGDLAIDALQVRRLTAACDECHRRLAELGEVHALLDDHAAEQHAVLQEVAAETAAADRDAVERFVTGRMAIGGRGFRHRRKLHWPQWIVAAAVLAGVLIAVLRPWDSPLEPIRMGPALTCDTPVGPDADFARFSWRPGAIPGVTFRIRVWPRSAGPTAVPALESPPLDRSPWTLTTMELDELPAAIRWEVIASRGPRDLHASARAEASR